MVFGGRRGARGGHRPRTTGRGLSFGGGLRSLPFAYAFSFRPPLTGNPLPRHRRHEGEGRPGRVVAVRGHARCPGRGPAHQGKREEGGREKTDGGGGPWSIGAVGKERPARPRARPSSTARFRAWMAHRLLWHPLGRELAGVRFPPGPDAALFGRGLPLTAALTLPFSSSSSSSAPLSHRSSASPPSTSSSGRPVATRPRPRGRAPSPPCARSPGRASKSGASRTSPPSRPTRPAARAAAAVAACRGAAAAPGLRFLPGSSHGPFLSTLAAG